MGGGKVRTEKDEEFLFDNSNRPSLLVHKSDLLPNKPTKKERSKDEDRLGSEVVDAADLNQVLKQKTGKVRKAPLLKQECQEVHQRAWSLLKKKWQQHKDNLISGIMVTIIIVVIKGIHTLFHSLSFGKTLLTHQPTN